MENGKPYSPNYITKQHNKLLKKYGFRHIRFHDLRHSCASLLNAQGFTLKDIQEWLGHSDIQTTANTYAHLDIKRKENISNTLTEIITKWKSVRQSVRQRQKNNRTDLLKPALLLWQGQKDLNPRHAVLERKARFQLSRVLKYSPPQNPHKNSTFRIWKCCSFLSL